MTNDIQLFHSDQFGDVRALSVDGEPWFVAKDVAKALGYGHTPHMTRRLDEDEKGVRSVDTPGGKQQVSVISEAGLYNAILGSKVPGAREFKRWVTHEVIPSIRRHGAYATPVTIDRIIADPQFGIRLLTELKEERDRSAALEAENHELVERYCRPA